MEKQLIVLLGLIACISSSTFCTYYDGRTLYYQTCDCECLSQVINGTLCASCGLASWVWVVIAVAAIVIIAGICSYMKKKRQRAGSEQTLITNTY